MIKEITKITKNNLDFNYLEENHISIQLSLDGFSFCIYERPNQDIVAFSQFEFNETSVSPLKHLELVKEVYNSNDLLQIKYKSVDVIHLNQLVSQVPQPLFNKENLAGYLNYSVKVFKNDYITYDQIKNTDIVNVYIPFININNFLIDTYGPFTFKHASTVLIESLINQYKNLESDYLFINVYKTSFEIVVLKNKKLELYNSFSFITKEDFIYYILFTAEQLNLNPEEFNMVLLGAIDMDSDLYHILYKYVRNIDFYSPTIKSPLLKGVPSHSNFALFNQI